MNSGSNILKIDNLSKYFGGLAAVSNCNLKIKKGSITGIIGPNGSGKTTLFNLIAGNLKASSGNVIFDDHEIDDYMACMPLKMIIFQQFRHALTRHAPKTYTL